MLLLTVQLASRHRSGAVAYSRSSAGPASCSGGHNDHQLGGGGGGGPVAAAQDNHNDYREVVLSCSRIWASSLLYSVGSCHVISLNGSWCATQRRAR